MDILRVRLACVRWRWGINGGAKPRKSSHFWLEGPADKEFQIASECAPVLPFLLPARVQVPVRFVLYVGQSLSPEPRSLGDSPSVLFRKCRCGHRPFPLETWRWSSGLSG